MTVQRNSYASNRCVTILIVATAILFGVNQTSFAGGVSTYTSSAEFFAALGGTPFLVEDYEGYPLDTVLGPGETFNGITYTSWSAGFGGLIGDDFANIGAQSLYLERNGDPGQGEGDFFFRGDSFSVAFDTQVTAIGMFFNVVAGPGEFMFIETPVGTASTGGFEQDMGTFFFAGLISTKAFSTATIGSTGEAPSGWNADNLIRAEIPTPGTLVLLAIAGCIQRKRRR